MTNPLEQPSPATSPDSSQPSIPPSEPGNTPSGTESVTQTDVLKEATPASLDELFSRDPLQLNDRDITTIVAELRSQRKNWLVAEAQGKRTGAKAKPGAKAKVDTTLDELGL